MSDVIPNPNTADTTVGTAPNFKLPPTDSSQSSLPESSIGTINNSGIIRSWASINDTEVQNAISGDIENYNYIALNPGGTSKNDGTFTNYGIFDSGNVAEGGSTFINNNKFTTAIGSWFKVRRIKGMMGNYLGYLPEYVEPNDNGLYPAPDPGADPSKREQRGYLPTINFTESVFINSAGASLFLTNGDDGAKSPVYMSLSNSGASLKNAGVITNNGFIDVFYDNAGIANNDGGRFENNGNINISYDNANIINAGNGRFTNDGHIRISYNNANITNSADGFFVNNGYIDLSFDNAYILNDGLFTNNGSITNFEANKGVTNNGTWTGGGSIEGSFIDNSKTAPGNSAGGMLLKSDYFKNSGSKEIELGGTDNKDFHRTKTEHDFIEVKGDMRIGDNVRLDVVLIDGFELGTNQQFIITKVDGELSGTYVGLKEGDLVGRFKNSNGGKSKLYISYKAGDGNDIALSTNRPIDNIVHANTNPPAGSSLLFGALADSGKIKQRKNGSYRMVLDGVDEIDWFTDRPERAEGSWKPQKLLRQWDKYFATSEPNAQITAKSGENRQALAFEMFKPKMKAEKIMFNVKPLTDLGKDKLTGLQDIVMSDVSLFIDNVNISEGPTTWQDELNIGLVQSVGKDHADLSNRNLMNAELTSVDLTDADLTDANLTGADLSRQETSYLIDPFGADLTRANLNYADLTDANLHSAILTEAILTNIVWNNTTCPDGTKNSGTSPCTAEQLNLA